MRGIAHGEAEDGQRGIGNAAGAMDRSVSADEIRNIVALPPAVGDGLPGIVSHATGALLMDLAAGDRGRCRTDEHLASRRFDHLRGARNHMANHRLLVRAELQMDAHRRYAPGVLHVRIDLHEIVWILEAAARAHDTN